ncbi:MAG: uL13 family ribosomal protein [Minisyncoccota bacterium]
MKHIIDATGKSIGRVATQAAVILIGKNSTSFARNIAPNVAVEVVHVGKLGITARKRDQETYRSFSGYPGGLTIRSMTQVVAKGGHAELLRIAIRGMLPKNKLREKMLKNLTVTE